MAVQLTEEVWTLKKKLALLEMECAQHMANSAQARFNVAKAESDALGDKWVDPNAEPPVPPA
jgi:hypothetical protein